MDFYQRIIEIIDANLIYCLVPIILTLMITEHCFKGRFETKKALNIIRWTIIIYTIITFTVYLIGMVINRDGYAFINRATGPYAVAYWIMLCGALILPLTLFNGKLASKFWYVLLVAFGMKSGVYFERFVIILTGIHRDYGTENESFESMVPFLKWTGLLFLQGIVISIVILWILKIMNKKVTLQRRN